MARAGAWMTSLPEGKTLTVAGWCGLARVYSTEAESSGSYRHASPRCCAANWGSRTSHGSCGDRSYIDNIDIQQIKFHNCAITI